MKRKFVVGRFTDKRNGNLGRSFGVAYLTNKRAEELRMLGFKVLPAQA